MTIQDHFDIHDQRIDLVPFPEGTVARVPSTRILQSTVWRAKQRLNITAILLSLPTIIAVIYFFGLAANRYESVATFVVRNPSVAAASELANLVGGAGDSGAINSPDDSYIVNEYMMSRDAMHKLIDNDGLLDVFRRSGWDPVWASPVTFWRGYEERLFWHYQDFISIEFDKTTEITTLRVQAFDPNDAQRIATALLRNSDIFLNEQNERAMNYSIAAAQKEVDTSKEQAFDALQKLTDFRNRVSVVDPTSAVTVVVAAMTELSLEMAQTNAQLAEVLKSSPDNPQIGTLRLRIAALENQMDQERAQFGGSSASLAPIINEYERLSLEREFSEHSFLLALSTLEAAKVDAQRRRTYLEPIDGPSLPDYPRYPFRLIWILAIGACSFATYWILRHLLRDTLGHAKGQN